jgi:hypothetical protein
MTDYRADLLLQGAAGLAMSALLARLDPDQGARPFFWIDFRESSPEAHHSYWDYCDIAGRFVDGLALARVLTGSAEGQSAEAALRRFLWAQQDPDDGLFYNPEGDEGSTSETSKYLDDTASRRKPRHVDLFCQRAPLLAMTTLLAMGDGAVRPRLQRMVRGLTAIAERNGDEARFPFYRWAPAIKPEWVTGKSAPECWLGYRYALLTALARYAELADDAEATLLATGLARFYMRSGDVPPDGRFRGNTHSGGILPTTVGIARLGAWIGDQQMLAWANRVYLWVREQTPDFGFLVDGLGLEGVFAGTCETCALTDLIHLAIILTEAGQGDYWDDIERYARNQLLENQYRDAGLLRRAFPGISDRVLAMLWGGFECAAHPNSLLTWNGAEGCCIGGGLRALYLTWRAAVAETPEETRVQLGFSRPTAGAEIVGYEPWRGCVEVRVRSPRRVLVRAPEGLAVAAVRTLLDGAEVPARWQGRYAVFDGLAPGQVAAITYPLRERRRSYHVAGADYTGEWRGNTLLEIRPAGERYPIYDRRALVAGDPPAIGPVRLARAGAAAPVPILW